MGMANLPRDFTAGTDSVLSIPLSTVAEWVLPRPAEEWREEWKLRAKKKVKAERDRRVSLVDPRLRRRALR